MRAEAAQRGEASRRLQRQLPALLAALLALLAVVLRGSVLTNCLVLSFEARRRLQHMCMYEYVYV
jgi:hypothetical protein